MSQPVSVTCRQIMNPDPPVLGRRDTVGQAVHMLLAQRCLAIPVVGDGRRYLGMFAKSRLFGMMLPATVALEEILPNMARVTDLAYLSDDIADLRRRFAELRDRPVCDYADPGVPKVKPDSPLMEALLLVYRTRNFLPVVEPDTSRLAGVISTWDILARLEGDDDA
jgi:CBS domain-containing protein